MSADTIAQFHQPLLLLAVLLIGASAGMFLEHYLSASRRKAWRRRSYWRWKSRPTYRADMRDAWTVSTENATPKPRDAADQLRVVMNADFAIQPLLNRSEARLFKELDRIVMRCNSEWQVMAQVSLGEVLRCKDAEAYSCINAKRVDLLLMDENCTPRHAIEYQGGAHHQGAAAARDAVKKEALRRAGIGYHEVVAGQTTPSELRRLVERIVDRPAAAQ